MKKILFLSALDFKEKSIQVIRNTPEAYVSAGWDVDYIVARDNLENGDYYYENEINPEGVNIKRCYWPFPKLRASLPRLIALLLGKLASFLVVLNMAWFGFKALKENKYDIIYGYEMQGVLAMNLLRLFISSETKTISRFQGTFLNEMFSAKEYVRLIFNTDLVLAIWLKSNLLIMTNDGTQGDLAVRRIKKHQGYNMFFWVNGVDRFDIAPDLKEIKKSLESIVFMSVSRLVGWKRVDRNIEILAALKDLGYVAFKYYVIGEGNKKNELLELVKQKDLVEQVVFVGALPHSEVMGYLRQADVFMSMYDSSNVGNPLLEAIRANKIIVTLNNGDTQNWIQHNKNGLIYNPNESFYKKAAQDLLELLQNKDKMQELKKNLLITEHEKLHTWDERLTKEISEVEKLCS
jgi:glycosyltransferase involved in cell wall biosynthesis